MLKKIRWGAVALLAVLAAAGFLVIKGFRILSALTAGNPLQAFQGIQNPRGQFPGKDRLTVLVVGKDYNRDRKGMPYTKNSRADTIMLLSVDMEKSQVSAVSIPRDTRVRGTDGGIGKINGTLARGGMKLLTETIAGLFDVRIDNTVLLKADAVREIVDAVGGVDVETIDEMHYDDNWGGLHIHLPKGRQRLKGEDAVGFVRFREVNSYRLDENGRRIPVPIKHSAEEGDIRRTDRQQQLVRALVNSAMQPGNLMQADRIIDVGFSQVETNLNRTQMLALATIMRGSGGKTMKSATIPGTTRRIDGVDYFVADSSKAAAIVDWLIKGDEQAANRAIKVAVYNGSSVSGAARGAADKLRKYGFSADSAGNCPKPIPATVVYYAKAAYYDRAKKISELLGGADVQKLGPTERPAGLIPNSDVMVVIGADKAEQVRQAGRESGSA